MKYLPISKHQNLHSFPGTILFIFFTAMLTNSCGTDALEKISGTWQFEGLEEIEVFELRAHNGYLYAGTVQGMYRSSMTGVSWQSMNLSESTVQTFAVYSGQELLASVYFNEADSSTIAKTTDGGESWVPFRNGFGGELRVTPRVIEIHPDDPDILYARGFANVAKSSDRGINWESIYLDWNWLVMNASLLEIDPNNPDIIWAGGSSGVGTPNLIKTEDGGANWENLWRKLQIFEDIVFSSTAYSIAIRPGHSSHLLLGLGVGIFRSTDLGESWESVFNEASILTMVNSPSSSRTVYASGINQQQSLFVLVTTDFGTTWQTIEMEDSPGDVRVNDMAVVEQVGKEVLFLGTNQGVFSFKVD
jgi:photosystem II stability/assembly factor-like uncharacterized protein